jgi:uncharacterized protein YdaU (DUF1376 family)
MNYYKRHLGDYAKDTRHLTLLEHGAYCLLLDYYYSTEKPIPDDRCERIAGARTEAEIAAVRSVLKEFFIKDGDVWRSKKADEVIAESTSKSAKARASASAKWGEGGAAATRSQRLAAARAIATHTKAEWLALVDACGNACVRCGGAGVVKDHITPIYQGGSDGIDNLQPLCQSCNSSKGPENKDFRPEDWRERLLERLRNASETPASHKPLANSHKKAKEAPDGAVSIPDVDPKVVADFLKIRKAKRAPLTETALAGIQREATKAGVTLEQALRTCCERGWSGFKADWVGAQAAATKAQLPGGGRREL